MDDPPRYWYGEKNFLGQRTALDWRGWVADGLWWIALPLAARVCMNPVDHPLLCTGLFFGWIILGTRLREWKGQP